MAAELRAAGDIRRRVSVNGANIPNRRMPGRSGISQERPGRRAVGRRVAAGELPGRGMAGG